ncbi:hypothetical protein RRF57_012471 [Xylaria bambusicola]|uniref:Uncharacterized protein n=1 Tax=Xylaria bambusicola TaxID=326684 RepID=A0AAN7UY25_9PEZI
MSDRTTSPCQNIPLNPPSSNYESVSEHETKSFGSQHHSPVNPREDTRTPTLAVESSEEDANLGKSVSRCDVPVEPVSEPRLSLQHSIGKAGLATIFGGVVLILALAAFLAFLWFGKDKHLWPKSNDVIGWKG